MHAADHTVSRPAPLKQSRRLGRALEFAYPYRHAVLVVYFITLILAGLNAAEPLVFKFIFDNLGSADARRQLVRGIVLLGCLSIFRELATAYSNWKTWHTRLGIHFALLETTVERLHRMPLSIHREEGVGAS